MRMHAIVIGVLIADSDQTVVVEGNRTAFWRGMKVVPAAAPGQGDPR